MKDHVDEPIEDVVENEEPTTDDVEEVEDDATQETSEETVATDEEPEGDDEFVVSFGDEEADEKPEAESTVIRNLRQKERKDRKRIKDLEKQVEAQQQEKAVELGPEPKIEDFAYDTAKHAEALRKHFALEMQLKEQEQAEKAKQEAVQKEFDAKLDTYNTGKSTLGVKDFDESEAVIMDTLSGTQQGVIVDVAQDAAKFVYALGKYPDKAEELAKITNPVQFAAAIARMESKMTVTGKKSKPAPEKRMKSTGGVGVTGEKKLEQLRDEAAKTGDYTKVNAYKRELRSK